MAMGDVLPPNYLLFVGNPGVGKSTLLNSLIGSTQFKSGVSAGSGKTTELQWYTCNAVTYGDTPGLSDSRIRKQAAEEITKALKGNGNYRLVFVCTLEAGRVRPDDVTTMKLVLEAINDKNVPYAIVINKISEKVKKRYTENPKFKLQVDTSLNVDHSPTDKIFLYSENEDLKDEDDKLIKPLPEFQQFLDELLVIKLKAEQVNPVKNDAFESQKQAYEEKFTQLKNDKEKLEIENKRQMEALQEKAKANEEIIKALRDSMQTLQERVEAQEKELKKGLLQKIVESITGN